MMLQKRAIKDSRPPNQANGTSKTEDVIVHHNVAAPRAENRGLISHYCVKGVSELYFSCVEFGSYSSRMYVFV